MSTLKRSMFKEAVVALFVGLCVMVPFLLNVGERSELISIPEEQIPLVESCGELIRETDADINVVPDKYNCGAKGELSVVTAGETVGNVKFKCSGDKNILEFGYGNKNISGIVKFENIDFSSNDMGFYNEWLVDRDIKVIFTNCKFAQIKTGQSTSRMQYEFNNCTIESFYGSNAVFSRCLFGESYRDAIIPFQNITVKDCFIKDMSSTDPSSAGIHSDGTQMFGHKDVEVRNVFFDNCRFEVPAIQTGGNSASVNACIMVQLEYNNGINIKFTNCKINGGGYSIYARTTRPEFYLDNVVFENIEVGCAKLFKTVYSRVSEDVEFINVNDTSSLYVGSVWKDGNSTHFSVTNDTNIERKLLIYTNNKKYIYEIPKCPDGKNLYADFQDYPFDIDIVIPELPRYAVCFEITEDGQYSQLRYVNWGKEDVYFSANGSENITTKNEMNEKVDTTTDSLGGSMNAYDTHIIASGLCGQNVRYALSADGVLRLWGTGATFNYHSKLAAPWYEVRDRIKVVEIGEGIVKIGNQCFRDCSSIKSVSLPNTLEVIGYNAFIRCSGLEVIEIPRNVREIDAYAFAATRLQRCIYYGSRDSWNMIEVGIRNELVTKYVSFV